MSVSGSQFTRWTARVLDRALSPVLGRRPSGTRAGRILLIKTHALGDVLMTSPAVRLLRDRLPDAELIFLTGRSAAPLLEGNPHLDRVVPVSEGRLLHRRPGAVRETVRLIRGLGCETAVIFHPAWPMHLLARLARVPVRWGFERQGSGFSLSTAVPWRGDNDRGYVVDDYLRLAAAAAGGGGAGDADRSLVLQPGPAVLEEAQALAAARGAKLTPPPVGLAPGGGVNPRDRVPEKRWPARRFAELADRLVVETGRPVWLFGSPGEAGLVREVAGLMKEPAVDFSGATSLGSLAGLIGRLGLLVTVDSAPMHIALALGVPLVGLFGPTRASALLPGGHPLVRVVEAEMDCSPCYNNEPFPGCRQQRPCMETIGLEAVYNSCMELLSPGGGAR